MPLRCQLGFELLPDASTKVVTHFIQFVQAAKSHDIVIIRNCFVNFRVAEVKNVLVCIQMAASPSEGEVKRP